jgi:hypothetical protein
LPRRVRQAKRGLIDTLRQSLALFVRVVSSQLRERRSGEIPVKVFAKNPERAKPKGASGGRAVKPSFGLNRGLRQGGNPGTAACRAGLSLRRSGTTTGRTVRGCIRAETFGYLMGGWLRRVNPRSAAGVKQNRPGIEGSKPSGG